MSNHDTPPHRPRPPQFSTAESVDDLRCPGCNMLYGHRAACPELADIRRTVALKAHATRHWVRAVTVKTAERTMRGVAECGFTYFAEAPLSEEPTTRRRGK